MPLVKRRRVAAVTFSELPQPARLGVIEAVFLPVLAVCWLGSAVSQVASYRRSSGERRLQLKWLLCGSAIAGVCIPPAATLSGRHGIPGLAGILAGAAADLGLPVCVGVAILKYRLFEIDRIISRTLAYAIVTGLLIGVYTAATAAGALIGLLFVAASLRLDTVALIPSTSLGYLAAIMALVSLCSTFDYTSG